MKTKYPPIVRFQDIKDLYSNIDFKSLIAMQKADKFETLEMQEIRESILLEFEIHSEILYKIESLMVKYKRLYIIENLDIHMTINTQIDLKSSNKNKYRTAKVMFPQVGQDDIGVRVSLGRLDDSKIQKSAPSKEDYDKVKKTLMSKM